MSSSGIAFGIARSQALQPRTPNPEPFEPVALSHHGRRRHAFVARRAPERLKVDVRRQILLAGIDQHRNVAMPANGLQRVPGRGSLMAVIDEQPRPAMIADGLGDRAGGFFPGR